jgi:hypothetical protein
MLCLILDTRFKNLLLASSFIGLEQNKTIVEKYDRKTLYPMLLKCYHHLHPLSNNTIVDQCVDENCSLDIFELIINTNELNKELVNNELFIFRRFQVDAKNIKCPFQLIFRKKIGPMILRLVISLF